MGGFFVAGVVGSVGRGCVLRGWGAVAEMRALRWWDLNPCGASADKPHLSAICFDEPGLSFLVPRAGANF